MVLKDKDLEVSMFEAIDAYIRAQKDDTIEHLCHICGVTRDGYYSWKAGEENRREAQQKFMDENKKLMDEMRWICGRLGYIPGTRSFRVFLIRDFRTHASRKKISKLMRAMHMEANRPIKDAYKGQDTYNHDAQSEENKVNGNFYIGPRRVVLTDITYLYYGKDRDLFYLCVFKDPYTTEILGFAIRRTMDQALVNEAYRRMMDEHGSELKSNVPVYIHSDHGSQYTSTSFKELLKADGFTQSLSDKGCPMENSPCESFYNRLKTNILSQIALCKDYESAKTLVENYIHAYNHQHYQYELAGLTPSEYYQLITTNVYPADYHYGVPEDKMLTAKELSDTIQQKRAARAEKRRKKAAARAAVKNASPDMRAILQARQDLSDMNTLYRQLCGLKKEATALKDLCDQAIEKADETISKVQEISTKIQDAIAFLYRMSAEQRSEYADLARWGEVPELSYFKDMAGLLHFKPYSVFCDDVMDSIVTSHHRRSTMAS